MSIERHCAAAALVILASTVPLLSGCPSTPTTPRPSSTPQVQSDPSSRTPAGGIVPVSFAALDDGALAGRELRAPMTLTAADGTELKLSAVKGRSVVQGPLAFTELDLAFENTADRTVEGRFRIALPSGAAVSRFAMMIRERWQEGEVVEKRRARRTFEDFLHRKQDPALLEQAAGNEFSARVFPIPPRSTKRLLLSYSQELSARSRTLVPLRGLPEVAELDLALLHPGMKRPVAAIRHAAYTPAGDFVVGPPQPNGTDGLRNGELVVARIRPPVATQPDSLRSAVILVDTSASRSLGLRAELELLTALVEHVKQSGGASAPLAVAGFDQVVAPVLVGRADGFGTAQLASLAQRGALGASNLAAALRWAGKAAKRSGATRLVLISDGVATAGAAGRAQLRKTAAKLGRAGVERIDAIALGGIRDEAALQTLVTAGLTRDGIVVDGEQSDRNVLAKLDRRTASKLAVRVSNATWSWPQQLDGVQAGDEVFVYAKVPAERPVRITVGGTPLASLRLAAVERPLLERSWARAKIDSLLEQMSRGESASSLRGQVIRLSTTHRVLSPYTSLLVLETERDYQRFGLDRNALADILTIEQDRLTVLRRTQPAPGPHGPKPLEMEAQTPTSPRVARRSPPSDAAEFGMVGMTQAGQAAPSARDDALPAPPLTARGNMWGEKIGESFGGGGLGLSGIGEGGGGRGEAIGLGKVGTIGRGAGTGTGQGFGAGHGRLGRSHRSRPPRVRMGATSVSGRLPTEIIQRIMRQNFGRFRQHYETGLRSDPNLGGRVVLRFVIARDGSVANVRAVSSEVTDQAMLRGLEDAVRALRFPKPPGGVVTVAYPIVFNQDGQSGSAVARNREGITPPRHRRSLPPADEDLEQPKTPALTGRLAQVMAALSHGQTKQALSIATAWRSQSPGDVLALVSLGEAYEASGAATRAARAYGSIIDMFPMRADLRRFASSRLERVKSAAALRLAVDSYRKARKQRPDHPSSHRLLAFALLKQNKPALAFDVLREALARRYPGGRFRGVDAVLREDLGLAAAAWMRAAPKKRDDITDKLEAAGGKAEDEPSLRFVLTWETDANDVDLHVHDAQGSHAFYSAKSLPSGGRLYDDVTTGYGPECFTIRAQPKDRSAFYRLRAHYYARGPMGYGMGKVQVVDHDGHGKLRFEERPFVVMNDQAYVNLGVVRRKAAQSRKVASRH